MSEEQQAEPLYGIEQIEASQGYQPMVLQSDLNAQASAEQHEQDLDTAVREFVESRPNDNPPPTERAFIGPDGNPTPENHTLSAEQAAKELAATRQNEIGRARGVPARRDRRGSGSATWSERGMGRA
jgi:hypothetical protein